MRASSKATNYGPWMQTVTPYTRGNTFHPNFIENLSPTNASLFPVIPTPLPGEPTVSHSGSLPSTVEQLKVQWDKGKALASSCMEKTSGKDVALIGDMDSSLPLVVANTPQEVEQQHKAPVLEQRRVDAPAVLPEMDTWTDDDLEPHDSTLVMPCGQLLESHKTTGTHGSKRYLLPS